ncbi:ribonuclease J [Geminicoccaceae bacterium 1502E]|nr:ribonuclease J [Geminicoccaceae bacterium 1502E]
MSGGNGKELRLIPLGGVGEIGLNVYLYGLHGRYMMVDLGLTFADDRLPGAEIVLPDLGFIEEQRDRLAGLVITHAHEDHLGAVPYLWPRLRCPIYCTPFAAAVLRRKFADAGIDAGGLLRVVKPGANFEIGPFGCRFIRVTHSVPEANALAIECEHGRVLHTGDWKLDPAPLVGEPTDGEALEAFGDDGVLALVCDSTNVLSPGTSGSEAEVRDSLIDLVAAQPNRVVVTTFASNLARLETAIVAGHAAGRQVFVVGRSMRRMLEAAREVGYLQHLPPLGDERDIASLPRHRVMLLCTGSQGESRAALARVAAGQHPRVRLEPGDTAIFSAKIIPGNERTLFNLHNALVASGVEVITEEDHFVHVSGHPCRDELEQMYRWIRPKVAVPVHGEARHLSAHIRLARRLGVQQPVLIGNGDVLRLAPGHAQVVGEVPTGRVVLESDDLVDAGDDLFRVRRRLSSHGTVMVSLVLDSFGSVLSTPQISAHGVIDPKRFERMRETLASSITTAVEALDDETVLDDGRVQEVVRAGVRQGLDLQRQRRPLVEVQIQRLTAEALEALEALEEEGTGVAR